MNENRVSATLIKLFTSNRKMIGLGILILSALVAGLDIITPPEVPTDALYTLPIWLGLWGFGLKGGFFVSTTSILLFYISNYLIAAEHLANLWGAFVLTYLLFLLFTYGAHKFLLNQKQLARTQADLQTRLKELDRLYGQSQQLNQENLKLAVTEERNRLAREIHDVLAQGLAAIIFQVEAAYLNRDKPILLEERLAQISELAHNNLQEARRSMANLRPLALEGSSLKEALEHKVQGFSKESAIPSQFTVTGEVRPLASDVERSLFRITQEALTNAVRHSQATYLEVMLDYDEEEVCLTVQDNGCGFELGQEHSTFLRDAHQNKPLEGKNLAPFANGFGLSTMQERATLIGGWATIQSKPGEGCRVRVIVPYIKIVPLLATQPGPVTPVPIK